MLLSSVREKFLESVVFRLTMLSALIFSRAWI
jgi:hypothetical protein